MKIVDMPSTVGANAARLKRTLLPRTRRATLRPPSRAIMGTMDVDELAGCLRAWRDRLQPQDVGLPAGAQRRAPGLRREEVAMLAGVSVDYLSRLEQGRAQHPSPSVLEPLARTLRLTDAEREHLFRVAGHQPTGRIDRHVTPSVQRVLDRLADVPVVVLDAAWNVVAWTPPAAALHGDYSSRHGRERNVAWQFFSGAPGRIVRDTDEDAAMESDAVADLRDALGRYPDDPELRALIEDLRRTSERFDDAWRRRPVAQRTSSRKTIDHPQVGRLTLDCDVLTVAGSGLRLVVYTAQPGSPDESALEMVKTLGLQAFA
jgi:transcriptional regulator with XRE-family HTH domain